VGPFSSRVLVSVAYVDLMIFRHHFVKTDVTSWESQVALFKEATEKSPGKHLDVVVANAGIGESDPEMFLPQADLSECDSKLYQTARYPKTN
jgi:NAD(P)-dependent dehydrogenase (short-subunit alcohol dehydrogenase family)